jgi:MFS family permease
MLTRCSRSIGNAKIAGMADDLKLDSSQYSLVLVVFFIGYVLFEPASNMVLVRSRPSLYLPAIMTIWGILTCIMSVVKSYHHLLILRVIIGIAEAGFAPGILLIISSWYKRDEQSKRFAVFISAAILSGAFGGLWDVPATSKRLSERERFIATTRLVDHGVSVRTADSPKLGKTKSFMLALTDRRTWGFLLGYMARHSHISHNLIES